MAVFVLYLCVRSEWNCRSAGQRCVNTGSSRRAGWDYSGQVSGAERRGSVCVCVYVYVCVCVLRVRACACVRAWYHARENFSTVGPCLRLNTFKRTCFAWAHIPENC